MPHPWFPDPAAPTYGAELQEEWSPDFREPKRADTGITEPGLAEIKPHKAPAIRKGLQQLREYLQKSESRHKAATSPGTAFRQSGPSGGEPARMSVWLVTYLPWPSDTNQPTHVRIFAHKLRRDELLRNGPLPGLESLTLSRRELPRVELPPSIPFPRLSAPDMFGMAVEPRVRDQFAKVYRRPQTHRQALGRKGADVLWRELAGLFAELANETGDGYWRELSDELTAELPFVP